jgi:hypothetical protein
MKTLFKITFGFCLALVNTAVYGQRFEVPINVSYKNAADYKLYERQVIAAIDWLEATPFDVEIEKRQQASSFITKWVQNTPSLSVLIMPYIDDLSKENPQLMSIFLGGWARYALKHPKERSERILNISGIQTVIRAYKKGGLKDPKVDGLVVLQNQGKLENWISERIKQ